MEKKIKYSWTKFCCEHPSKIEGYDRWLNDSTGTKYHCHHRLEIELGMSRQELKDENLYYGRPASELIIMTKSEHMALHKTGKHHTEETRRKIGEANRKTKKDVKWWNNGVINKLAKECPGTDFVPGRLDETKKGNQYTLGKHWWNNGIMNKRSKTCPGPDFVPGRLVNK